MQKEGGEEPAWYIARSLVGPRLDDSVTARASKARGQLNPPCLHTISVVDDHPRTIKKQEARRGSVTDGSVCRGEMPGLHSDQNV